MLFNAWNYKALAIGLLLVITGFVAMYIENEVEGFISLFVSPIVIMAGYITVIFAIMKHDRQNGQTPEHTSG
ncbi:DUF3098 domain-containing protein [Balneolaceae bacterium YR4-1]|uniref:DUF3098 domain-containing protein n=2 Tax=Halalkalibaculum roseum TaxID=2709311 RepID=A0A6M1SMA7_9BACT|nr:DUF3098 domain-containing protein [Halalkalibaculum roseum]